MGRILVAYWACSEVTKKIKCEPGSRRRIQNTSFSSQIMNGPYTLACYIKLRLLARTREQMLQHIVGLFVG
jgi:hypothetical protein